MSKSSNPEHQDAEPVETPESRMTGEGGPPPTEEQKDRSDGPEFAAPTPSEPQHGSSNS
ncbi:hypothetical protein [Streptomyces tateyamensis]|uniref:hypothetical protein n=1 Tax=Streptomyces tateyamensis TaxID=565073 RepID=UPI0015E8D51C|nr:hypothetical protein [Streptomyces tateyamensis]